MDSYLTDLRRISRDMRYKRKEHKKIRAKCLQWNGWAKKQPEYFVWASENAFTPDDLRYSLDLGEPVDLDWESGAAYFAHLHLIKRDLKLLGEQEEKLLKYLWETLSENGRYKYSLVEIADAHESTDNYLYKHLRDFSWFKPRNHLPGKKTHVRHLKVVDNEI